MKATPRERAAAKPPPPDAAGATAKTGRATATRSRRQRPGTAVLEKGRQSAVAVLDAAAALLAAEGAAGLSTRKIAARAGMHAGNVQYYFRTKRDVVRALLERHLDQSRERVEQRMGAAPSSPREGLQGAIEEILADQGSAADCALFRELWALAAHDREIAAVVEAFYARYVDEVAGLLRRLSPGLAAARAKRVATLLVSLLEGMSIVSGEAAAGAASRRRAAAEIAAVALQMVKGS